MHTDATRPRRGVGEQEVFDLLARCAGANAARLADLARGTARASALPALVAAGVLDRVSARAVGLVLAGSLDERDLKQLIDLPLLRTRIDRLAIAAGRTDAAPTHPLPLPLPLDSPLGRYTIRGLLGRGGSGHVYLSVHPEFGVPLALKVSMDATPLRAEAAILTRITHRNVVRVWDLERAGRLTILVLEYVDGGSLGRRLTQGRPLSPAMVLRVARDILSALRAAHGAGVIHGDVKPANILGPSAGRFKLADFGTARRPADSLTGGGTIHGTWPYTAPESFDGRVVPESDVYSLGLTLYHAMTGQPAVPATGYAECRAAHAKLTLDPLHWTVPGVSQRFSDLIRRMTSPDPAARPSVALLLREFRSVRIAPATALHPETSR